MKFLSTCISATLLSIALHTSSYANTKNSDHIETDINSIKTHYEQKDFFSARQLIEDLRANSAPLHLEILFLSGMIYQEQGNYRLAIEDFREMLSREPELLRPRLELARTLQLSRDFQAAKYHYEQVLGQTLPINVIQNILVQLNRIRETEPSIRFNLELTSDTNPNQSTNNQVVYIQGIPFKLRDNQSGDSVWGISSSLEAIRPFTQDPSWYLRGYAQVSDYAGRSLDEIYLSPSLGKRFTLQHHRLSFELGAHAYNRAGKSVYDGLTFSATSFQRPTPKISITSRLDVKQQDYSQLTFLDGYQKDLSIYGVYVPNQTSRWESSLGIYAYDAKDDAFTYYKPRLSVRYAHEFPGGWISGARLQYSQARYAETNPFFGVKRRDDEYRLSVDILNRHFSWYDFSPRLTFSSTKRDSNIPLYEFKRNLVSLGITKDF